MAFEMKALTMGLKGLEKAFGEDLDEMQKCRGEERQ
jgi:hypothetical protein